jgi:hypothetical protein
MAVDRDLPSLLRAHDDRLRQSRMSVAARVRIHERLRAVYGKDRVEVRRVVVTMLAGAAMGAGVTFGWAALRSPSPTLPSNVDAPAAMVSSDAGSCTIEERTEGAAFSGRCTLQLRFATIRTEPNAEVRSRDDVVEVLSGRAWFDVAPVRAGGPPVRVRVAGGVIEVVGTQFLIEQEATSGSVELFEGVIRFRASSGRAPVEIRAGEKFRWSNPSSVPAPAVPLESGEHPQDTSPVAPTPPARSAARAPRPPSPAATQAEAEPGTPQTEGGDAATASPHDIALRVMRLRSEGRYEEAAAALAQAHSAKLDARTAEVLSFEEGEVLEHLGDTAKACAHWKEHARRFPDGRYRDFVATKTSRLACP